MNELNLAVYTNKTSDSQVTMTAKFASHADAVAFHDDIASICKKHSASQEQSVFTPRWKLLSGKA